MILVLITILVITIIPKVCKLNWTIVMTTFLLLVGYSTSFAQNTSVEGNVAKEKHDHISKPTMPPKPIYMYGVREVMPRFPGCEDIEGSDREKKQCADGKLMCFIYENLIYPPQDKDKGVEGTVIVSFVVNKVGRLENIKLLRGMDTHMGTEALKVVHLMNELPEGWTPAKQRGKVVEVQYCLPIRFQLD